METYPLYADSKTQLIWLVNHSKKKKDATSSGLQIIAILLRDPNLAQQCNLIGDEFVDIYADQLFNDYTLLREKLEEIITSIFNISSLETLESIKYTNTNDIFSKLQSFLVDSKISLLEICKLINSSYNSEQIQSMITLLKPVKNIYFGVSEKKPFEISLKSLLSRLRKFYTIFGREVVNGKYNPRNTFRK